MNTPQPRMQEVVLGEMRTTARIVEAEGGIIIQKGGPDLFVPNSDLEKIERGAKEAREEEEQMRSEGKTDCPQCGEWFAPRRSGGRPQRFCAEECRRAFHAENSHEIERHQRVAPSDHVETYMGRPSVDDEWDWNTCDSVVVPRQDGFAVYWNRDGDACIRREAQHHPCEDEFISIPPQHLPLIIAALQEKHREFEQGGAE